MNSVYIGWRIGYLAVGATHVVYFAEAATWIFINGGMLVISSSGNIYFIIVWGVGYVLVTAT